ncbi:MAG: DUF4097 domain-containing protein [Phycisphaerales bacterium]|nr:DUF4097 domain-containing protein [Phycisphaerales bacterium]
MRQPPTSRCTRLLMAAIAGTMLLLGGCTHFAFGTRTSLEVDGPVVVDIVTFAGDVTIRSTGNAPGEPYVLVKPSATHGFHRMGDAQASLDEIDWSVETVEEGGRTVVRVRADTLYPESGMQRLHVTVSAADVDGLRVKTRLGDVDVLDIQGPIDIDTTRGDISIVTNRPLHGPISAMTTEGDITLRAPPQTSGRLDFFTGDGRVTCSVPDSKLRVTGRTGERSFQGILNDGHEPITLRTNDGRVRVVVKTYPYQQSSLLFD